MLKYVNVRKKNALGSHAKLLLNWQQGPAKELAKSNNDSCSSTTTVLKGKRGRSKLLTEYAVLKRRLKKR